MAGEALAVTMLITPAVIHSRRAKLHCSRSERHFARLGATVAHHQGVPMLATLAVMALNVIVDLGPERFAQHPPCALARDLMEQQKLLTCSLSSRFSTTFSIGGVSLPPGSHRVLAFAHAEGYAAFFKRVSHPQLSVIAPRGVTVDRQPAPRGEA
jgi:hypothetical protein